MKTPTTSIVRLAVRWIRAFGLLRLILLAVSLASLLFLYIDTGGRLLEASVWSVPLVLEILILSWPWRTVSLRSVAFFFLVGFGPVFLLTILSQRALWGSPIENLLGGFLSQPAIGGVVGYLGGLDANLWAPITEEVWKVIPLLLLFWWWRSGLRTQAGPLDLAVLAGATGAGMEFAEGIFVIGGHGAVSPVFGLGLGPLYIHLVVNPTTPSDWWTGGFYPTYQYIMGFLIASIQNTVYGTIWAGHGTFPLAFGLALGLAVLGARRWKSRVVYLLPAFVLLWSIWEHIMVNWYQEMSCQGVFNLLCTLSKIDLRGRLFPVVVVLGWIFSTVLSHMILRRHRDPETAFPWREMKYEGYKSQGLLGSIAFLKDLLTLLRFQRKTAYGFFHFEASSEKDQEKQMSSLLATRAQAYFLALRLRGQPGPVMTAEARQALDWATPVA